MVYPRIVQLKHTYVVLPLGSAMIWMFKNWFDKALERGILHANEYNQFVPSDLGRFILFYKLYEEYEERVRKNDEQGKFVEQLNN